MKIRRLFANTLRILLQLKHDPRTIALMIIAPCFLMTILKFVYYYQEKTFQQISISLQITSHDALSGNIPEISTLYIQIYDIFKRNKV